jgi:hypothetical protein
MEVRNLLVKELDDKTFREWLRRTFSKVPSWCLFDMAARLEH